MWPVSWARGAALLGLRALGSQGRARALLDLFHSQDLGEKMELKSWRETGSREAGRVCKVRSTGRLEGRNQTRTGQGRRERLRSIAEATGAAITQVMTTGRVGC